MVGIKERGGKLIQPIRRMSDSITKNCNVHISAQTCGHMFCKYLELEANQRETIHVHKHENHLQNVYAPREMQHSSKWSGEKRFANQAYARTQHGKNRMCQETPLSRRRETKFEEHDKLEVAREHPIERNQ